MYGLTKQSRIIHRAALRVELSGLSSEAKDPTSINGRLKRLKSFLSWPDKYDAADFYSVVFALGFGSIPDSKLIEKFAKNKNIIFFALDTYTKQQRDNQDKLMWRIAKTANT